MTASSERAFIARNYARNYARNHGYARSNRDLDSAPTRGDAASTGTTAIARNPHRAYPPTLIPLTCGNAPRVTLPFYEGVPARGRRSLRAGDVAGPVQTGLAYAGSAR